MKNILTNLQQLGTTGPLELFSEKEIDTLNKLYLSNKKNGESIQKSYEEIKASEIGKKALQATIDLTNKEKVKYILHGYLGKTYQIVNIQLFDQALNYKSNDDSTYHRDNHGTKFLKLFICIGSGNSVKLWRNKGKLIVMSGGKGERDEVEVEINENDLKYIPSHKYIKYSHRDEFIESKGYTESMNQLIHKDRTTKAGRIKGFTVDTNKIEKEMTQVIEKIDTRPGITFIEDTWGYHRSCFWDSEVPETIKNCRRRIVIITFAKDVSSRIK